MAKYVLITLVAAFALSATPAFAQNAGLSLIPSIIEEGVDPGGAFSTNITVTNQGGTEETYFLFIRDIAGVTDGGRPIYRDESTELTGEEMTNWTSLGQEQVTLGPGEEIEIPLVVRVPADISPGSHFGAVFASLNPPPDETRGVGAAVGYQVGNIISLRVSGDVIEEALIRSVTTDKRIYSTKDVAFTARVENKGNVLIRPRGPIDITNMLGDKVATPMMNQSQSAVFPGAVRELTGTWDGDGLGFGRYDVTVALVYGEPGQGQRTMSAQTSFWILPWAIIKPLLITLAVVAVVGYVAVRYYIKNQVRKLSGGRRLVRTVNQQKTSTFVLFSIVMLFTVAFMLLIVLLLFA